MDKLRRTSKRNRRTISLNGGRVVYSRDSRVIEYHRGGYGCHCIRGRIGDHWRKWG